MKRTLQIFFVSLALIGATAQSQAQSTAFTYHGRLNNNGAPVTGAYDMQFSVFDADTGNGLVAGPLPANAVGVTNGLFTARIDFGAGVFTGPARWLEIQVRPAGNGQYQTLGPRQELTSSPYSIRALSAGTAAEVSNGSVVKSLNTLKDDVTLAAGANVTLTPNGNTLTIDAFGGGGGSIWSLNGGSAYYNGGNVGIGTTQPQGLLDLITGASDTSALFVRADPGSFGRGGIIHHQSSTYGWQELAQTTASPDNGYLTFNYVNRLSPGTKIRSDVLTLRANGHVGIGTSTPEARLDIGNVQNALRITGFEPVITMRDNSFANARTAIQNVDGGMNLFTESFLSGANLASFIRLDNNGNVGVGTTTPAVKLDVAGDMRGTRLILRADPLATANATVLCDDPNVANFVPYNTATARPLNLIVRDATVRQLTITGGADLAEPFPMDAGMEKGSVVVIDPENPGRLKRSTQSYDKRVAGIISGANGIDPGIALKQEGTLDQGENVALTGRVYVLADASRDGIEPGDLLTTSDTPGHAMKVTDHAKAQGAILGKAMGRLKEGKGMVLVLVTLQ